MSCVPVLPLAPRMKSRMVPASCLVDRTGRSGVTGKRDHPRWLGWLGIKAAPGEREPERLPGWPCGRQGLLGDAVVEGFPTGLAGRSIRMRSVDPRCRSAEHETAAPLAQPGTSSGCPGHETWLTAENVKSQLPLRSTDGASGCRTRWHDQDRASGFACSRHAAQTPAGTQPPTFTCFRIAPHALNTADISTPMLALVLVRASRSLAEFLESGLAREGFRKADFTILEVLLHKGPSGDRGHRAEGPSGDGSPEGGDRSPAEARHGPWARRSRPPPRGVVRADRGRTQDDHQDLCPAYRGHRIRDGRPFASRTTAPLAGAQEDRHSGRALPTCSFQGPTRWAAPWQLRRATEYMTEHLTGTVLLKDLAGQTGSSPSRFGRAFKLSMGISPHRWQMKLRVLEAQGMLRDGKRSQARIALATGFSEQSHFSRVFKEVVGMPPGAWQRVASPMIRRSSSMNCGSSQDHWLRWAYTPGRPSPPDRPPRYPHRVG